MLQQPTFAMARHQIIIGRAEYIDIVGVSLGVPAKVDTGAFRSAVHATGIKEITKDDGTKVLRFTLFGHKCAPVKRRMEVSRYDKISVRSSNGKVESRYEVTLRVKIGPKVFDTSFTLANRSKNVYSILVGRKALKGRFVIDPSKASVTRNDLRRDFGLSGPDTEEDLED